MKVKSKRPVIFNFQVTEMNTIRTTKEFKEWEQLMRKNVGIKVDAKSIAMASATTSCSPDCDDCDMV